MTLRRLEKILHTPIALIAIVALGLYFGLHQPRIALLFQPLTDFYLGLLKMVVLPFLVSSIIFGLRSLMKDSDAGRYVTGLFGSFVVVSLLAVGIGAGLALWMQPGRITDPAILTEFGRIISRSGSGTDLQLSLRDALPEAAPNPFVQMIVGIVPSNVFEALAAGDVVKVLVFAVLFGLAVSRVSQAISDPFGHCLETIYRTCMVMTGWFTRFLPIVTFAMVAQHAAEIGPGTLLLMVNFLAMMAVASAVVVVLSVVVIAWRAKHPLGLVVRRAQEIAGMSLSTNSSTACIPTIIDALIKLGFRREVMELIVPLGTAMVRAGPIICYVAVPIFVAQLYGRHLGPADLAFLFASAALLGSTTAGMSGILVLAQVGIICKGLHLPFEAAFVLLASVDEFSNTFRTLMLVFATAGAAAVITPRVAAGGTATAEDRAEVLVAPSRAT